MLRSSLSRMLAALVVLTLMCGCASPRIDLAVASLPNVNPDHTGRPSPVIVKVFEMQSDLAFSQSDFRPLFETPVQVLGAELLAADEMVLVPGEARRITYEPVKGSRFLGVVAGFRQIERARWKIVTPVDYEDGNTVGIELRDVTVGLIPRDQAPDWDPVEAVKSFRDPSGPGVSTVEGFDLGESPSVEEGRPSPGSAALPMPIPSAER